MQGEGGRALSSSLRACCPRRRPGLATARVLRGPVTWGSFLLLAVLRGERPVLATRVDVCPATREDFVLVPTCTDE